MYFSKKLLLLYGIFRCKVVKLNWSASRTKIHRWNLAKIRSLYYSPN